VKAVCGVMPWTAGCGAMPHDGDGVVISILEESAMSRAGRWARWHGDWRCDGAVHGKIVAVLQWCCQVVADSPY
jgi:hypothetical protein